MKAIVSYAYCGIVENRQVFEHEFMISWSNFAKNDKNVEPSLPPVFTEYLLRLKP